jgi:subtilisin family serine protease
LRRLLALVLPALGLLLPAVPAAAAPAPAERLVVKVTGGAATASAVGDIVLGVSDDTFLVDARPGAAARPGVVWAAPDTVYRSTATPNDPCWSSCTQALDGQAELRTIRAPEAWDITRGSSSVTVAVLDNAADGSHPDLAGKLRVGPTYVTGGCLSPPPTARSHGTAVAGIVGAATDNGLGVASLGWQTQVVSVGVLDGCGQGTASGIAAGIRYATDVGARVVNLSLAGQAHPALEDAIRYAQARGALVVAAAGNHGSTSPVWPASYPDVLAVAATDRAGTAVSPFSGRGSWVELAAPGVDIVSTATLPGGYARFAGTSFSAPLVAATAALVMAAKPHFTAADVAFRLRRSARPLAGTAWGMVDAARAVTDRPGGFVLAGADGAAYRFGTARFHGSLIGRPLLEPVVATAATPSGYWMAASDGGVFAFGGVGFHGSMGHVRLNRPVVGMAATPSGRGYWLVASDGGIFSFGDARFFGSTGNMRLNQPIVGMAATPSGRGYWLVASDGGIFTFGDAAFAGSTGNIRLVSPVVGMAARSASSYWLVARDGGVFTFGGAPFMGSAAGAAGNSVVGIATGPNRAGYWLATSGGRIFPFGDVVDDGAVRPPPPVPVVGIASTAL